MDAPPDATDAAPAPAAPAGEGPSAWHLAALAQPALVFAGDWLPVLPRLWLEWTLQAVRSALEQTLDRPVQVAVDPNPGTTRDTVFAISFTHPALAGTGVVSLDLACGRLILDAIESDFANVRGTGSLSEAELGLLEYATLATLDGVLRSAPHPAQSFVVRGFHDARQAARFPDAQPSAAAIAVRVRCGGREGTARLHLPGFSAAPLPPPPAVGAAPDEPASLELRVALPPIALPRADARSLQPGDLLLLAAKDLHAFATDCRLATSNGWTLASATIVRDSPTVMDVRCGAFVLGTLPVAGPDGDSIILNPLIGSRRVTTEHVERWQAGEVIDVAKDTVVPVELFEGLDLVGRGELVRFDGELAVRLVEVTGRS